MKTINAYVKNKEVRNFIKGLALIGYLLIGILWWALYLLIIVSHKIISDAKEAMESFRDFIADGIHSIKYLHKKYSYFDMLMIAIGTVAIAVFFAIGIYVFVLCCTLAIPRH